MPTPTAVKRSITRFLGALRSGVWVIKGAERLTGEPFSLLFVGSEKQKAYVLRVAFNDEYVETDLGKLYAWQILFLLRVNRHDCDVAMIEGGGLHRSIYQNKSDYFLPLWLKSIAATPLRVTGNSLKEDLRVIRKAALRYEVTTEMAKLDDFYNCMYLPTINARHGDTTIETEYSVMEQQIAENQGVLLLVFKDDVSIAGVFVSLEEIPRLWTLGIRDYKQEYRSYCASTAAYMFAAEYLAAQGYSTMHLGMSRGFLNDGILQYKKKFSQQIIGAGDPGFILKMLRNNKATDNFLSSNPFVYLNEKSLIGAVFLDKEQPESEKGMNRLKKKYEIMGLSGLEFYVKDSSLGVFSKLVEC